MNHHQILPEELLKKCLQSKIAQEWEQNVRHKWHRERWYKSFKHQVNDYPLTTQQISNLPNGFYISLAEEINEVIQNYLNLSNREMSRYTTSASSLKRFLGKSKSQSNHNEKKKTGLTIYVGYRQGVFYLKDWGDFQKTYQEYLRFWNYWEQNTLKSKQLSNTQSLSHQPELISMDFPSLLSPHSKEKYQALQEATQMATTVPITPPQRDRSFKLTPNIILWLVVLWLIVIIGWLTQKPEEGKKQHIHSRIASLSSKIRNQIKFNLVKQTKGENKSTLVFSYNLGNASIQDSFYIQPPGNTIPRKQYLTKSSGTVSFVFYRPSGNFILGRKKKTIKLVSVYQESDGWVGFSREGKQESPLMSNCQLIKNGYITLPPALVPKAHQRYYFSHLSKNKHFQVYGNHMTAEIRFRLEHIPLDANCNHLNIDLRGLGTQRPYAISYPMEIAGCEYWMMNHKAGLVPPSKNAVKPHTIENDYQKSLDLFTKFTHDIDTYREWNTIKIVTQGNVALYYWNDQMIARIPFSGNIGEIQSIVVSGKGSWAIDWIRLKNGQGHTKYFEDFEDCANLQ